MATKGMNALWLRLRRHQGRRSDREMPIGTAKNSLSGRCEFGVGSRISAMQRSARIRTEPIRYCYPFLEACTSGVTADTDNLGVSWRPGFFFAKVRARQGLFCWACAAPLYIAPCYGACRAVHELDVDLAGHGTSGAELRCTRCLSPSVCPSCSGLQNV